MRKVQFKGHLFTGMLLTMNLLQFYLMTLVIVCVFILFAHLVISASASSDAGDNY